MSRLGLEMMLYSDNGYGFTNYSWFSFETFLAYSLFLQGFIVARHQMAKLDWEDFLPWSIIGVSQIHPK